MSYDYNLDAKPCVSDLDAHRFCRGYTNPLAMMGVALDRCLPGYNAMLANEVYVKTPRATVVVTPGAVSYELGSIIVVKAFFCSSVGSVNLPLFKRATIQWSKNHPSEWNKN